MLLMLSLIEPLECRTLLSDVVLDWNSIAIDAMQFDRTYAGPVRAARNLAITQAAVYDAINGVEQTHQPYFVFRGAPGGTNAAAAVASAAARALAKLFPAQKRFIANELRETLADIPDGPAEKAGVKYGKFVAGKILSLRNRDGSRFDASYVNGNRPGDWRPTPPDFSRAVHAGGGDVSPFSISRIEDFLPLPPPRLDSAEYAAAYNEVISLGDKGSATRTEDQTQIGLFWAYDRAEMGTPLTLYNKILQTIGTQQGNSPAANARLFATANIAMADAGIVAWECKFTDNLWRPITGIRNGDLDGNVDTVVDTTWEPLGAPDRFGDGFTPPFPAYVSGHSTFGAALFRTIENFYGTGEIPFQLTSQELPGVTRTYTNLAQAAKENGDSRIYLGVHWRFDDTYGQQLGREVADAVFSREFATTANTPA
jgi:hypothetical protein